MKLTVRGFIDPDRGLGHYDLEAAEIEKPVGLTGDDARLAAATAPPEPAGPRVSIRDLFANATRDSDGQPFAPSDEPPLASRRASPENTGRWAREGVSDILQGANAERVRGWFAPKLDAARVKLQDRF